MILKASDEEEKMKGFKRRLRRGWKIRSDEGFAAMVVDSGETQYNEMNCALAPYEVVSLYCTTK